MIIKHQPEDFIVEEIPQIHLSSGKFEIHKVWKKNLNTEDVVRIIEQRFGVPRTKIKYAGAKDKSAVTTQYFSIERKIINLIEENLKIEHIGQSEIPLSLGSLEGNMFTIILREITAEEKQQFHRVKEHLEKQTTFTIPNYFDDQRFSTNNSAIGIALVQKKFKEAGNQ